MIIKLLKVKNILKSVGSVVGEEGTEIGHSGGQDQLLQTSGEETGLSLQQQQFLAVVTLGFINIIPLLLDLVYHNRILLDFTDVNNNNNMTLLNYLRQF